MGRILVFLHTDISNLFSKKSLQKKLKSRIKTFHQSSNMFSKISYFSSNIFFGIFFAFLASFNFEPPMIDISF